MDYYDYDVPEQFQPISAWGYFGYTLLFALPLVGFILLIVFSLSNQNINRRNFARSFFCGLIVMLCLLVFGLMLAFATGSIAVLYAWVQQYI